MIVKCGSCGTKYNLADDRLGADGATVRCSRCKNVFHVDPPAQAAQDSDFAPKVDDFAAKVDDFALKQDAPAPDSGREKQQFSVGDLADLDFGSEKTQSFFERRKRLFVLGGGLCALLLLTLGALYFLDLLPFGQSAPKSVADTPAKDEKKQESERDRVKDIALQNVRQYFVNNDKAGSVFVIEGKAVNNFKILKGHIRIEATLFDANGVSVASKQRLAGNTVSYFQLQVLTEKEIEDALNSELGILTTNTTVKPGEETPFMFVFYNPPESLKEFKVNVIDVKDPAN